MKYRAIRVSTWLAFLTAGFVLNAATGPAARADAALAVAYQSWGLCADYGTPAEAETCAMRMCQVESRANSSACEIIFVCYRGGFGALAASPDSELLGAVCGHFSPESAAASAIKQCTDGGPGCGVVAHWQDYKGADPAVVPKGIE
jgi:hypothetical protein